MVAVLGKTLLYVIGNFIDPRFQSPHHLPVLELDTGEFLFSTNSASRLLFPPLQSSIVAVDQWLEWESSQLQVIQRRKRQLN
jgi:hypothetical protein